MLSTSKDRLKQFVKENLETLEGVVSVDIGLINRSRRVAPAEMWRKYRESKYVFKPSSEQEEYDFLEHTTHPGAPARELETSSYW
jgi:hypothetical protein